MIALIWFVPAVLASPFKSKSRLEAENAVLRHQLIVLRRKLKGRARLTNNDRWFFVQMYRCFPSILKVVTIVQPEKLVSWHRAGFRRYWRWKSRRRGGRPPIEAEYRTRPGHQTGIQADLFLIGPPSGTVVFHRQCPVPCRTISAATSRVIGAASGGRQH